MPRYKKAKLARLDAARRMREKKEKEEELRAVSPPQQAALSRPPASPHHPAITHTSSPLPSTSKQSLPPQQLTAQSHEATKLDLRIQLFYHSFPLPHKDDEKYIISRSQLEELASKICSKCSGERKIEAKNNNFDCTITTTCHKCGDVSEITPRRTVDDAGHERQFTDLNCKLVYEALINDLGCAGLNRIAQAQSIPPMSSGKFNRHANYLYARMWKHYEDAQKKAVDGIFRHYASIDMHPNPVTKQLDIAGSFDGTWRKRGHTSHIGGWRPPIPSPASE